MDIETIIYIAIFILFSIFSGKKKSNKNKPQQEEEYDEPETTLEDEIRRMAEQMTGKKTEEVKETEQKPEYTAQETKKEYKSPYETYDRKTNYDRDVEPLEQIPTEPATSYSTTDVERLRKYNEQLKEKQYEEELENYEAKSVESLMRGQELHSIMVEEDEEEGKGLMEIIDERFDYSNFDPRKAVIFTEILKRPEY